MTDSHHPILTPDVCVVGAGPAGLATTLGLARAGHRVVLLESGSLRSSNAAQQLNDGDHEGEPYKGLTMTRHRQVGGTVNTWNTPVQGQAGAKYGPLDASDLSGWPIGLDELRPYYLEAQKLCGLGPFEYGAEYWATTARRPFQLDGTGLTSGVYQFGLASRFTSTMVQELRASEAVTLLTSATVVGLLLDHRRGNLAAVRAVDRSGRAVRVEAGSVVLACGAVENARLMLLAGLDGEDRSGWLGRGFMEHPRDYSLLLVPFSSTSFADATFYDLHRHGDTLVAGRLGLTKDAMSAFGLGNASLTLLPRPSPHTGRGIYHRVIRTLHHTLGVEWRGGYGWSRVRAPAKAFDAFTLVLNLEQRPVPSNRVELSGRLDRFGNPLPRLVLRWSDQEQAELERLRELMAEWFRDAGLGRLVITRGQRPDLNAHHHAGTTRMGIGPDDGVVDAEGRVFGISNLYVAGASVFPTAGFANPTLTIVAMSLRLARQVGGSPPPP